MHGRRALMLASLLAASLLAAGCEKLDDANFETSDTVNLGIPDRWWDPGHNVVGWCGETCIQEALAFYGREVPQAVITEENLDLALDSLRVSYEAWDESNHDLR